MTFWRWLFFLVKVGLVALLALWIAERPGHVSFVWLGWRLDTSIGVLAAALLLLIAASVVGHRLWRLLWRGPRDLGRLRAERRRQQGYRALSQGMAAVAAGDAAEARRQARLANSLLKDPPLTLLLAAQTAQLGGDESAARRYFTAMLERPETAFLGLRGLLMQALKSGDKAEALSLARRAYEERPNTPWAVATLLDLQLELADWQGAAPLLTHAAKLKALPEAEARRKRAVLAAERAESAPPAEALAAAREAVKLAPDLAPARARLAQLWLKAGRARKAAKILEEGWRASPHPDLAAAYAALVPAEAPLERFRRFARLAELAPDHRESRLALGECALAAELWAEGRKQLEAVASAEGERASHRLARLMARLEEGERGDGAAVRRWLTAAAEAEPDPGWRCSRCGAASGRWQANCPNCRAFDSLAWQAPPVAAAAPGALLLAQPVEATPKPAAVPATTERAKEPPAPAPVDAARLVN
jgi:HemY protein